MLDCKKGVAVDRKWKYMYLPEEMHEPDDSVKPDMHAQVPPEQ